MKKLLIPALAVAVASAALPAAAQSYDRHGPSRGPSYEQNYNGWNAIAQRKYNLDRRVHHCCGLYLSYWGIHPES